MEITSSEMCGVGGVFSNGVRVNCVFYGDATFYVNNAILYQNGYNSYGILYFLSKFFPSSDGDVICVDSSYVSEYVI